MTEENHTYPRDCVATTTHSYNTHDIENYGMLMFHRRRGLVHGFSLGLGCMTMQRSNRLDDGSVHGFFPLVSRCVTREQNTEVECRGKTVIGKDSRELRQSMEESSNDSGEGWKNDPLTPNTTDASYFLLHAPRSKLVFLELHTFPFAHVPFQRT
jgi:hypothetical protein